MVSFQPFRPRSSSINNNNNSPQSTAATPPAATAKSFRTKVQSAGTGILERNRSWRIRSHQRSRSRQFFVTIAAASQLLIIAWNGTPVGIGHGKSRF
jgi:hypothetical protein